jgi:hypothetical protein
LSDQQLIDYRALQADYRRSGWMSAASLNG